MGISTRALKSCLVVAGAVAVALGTSALPAGATSNAQTLYRQAFATTKAWSVHYASDSTVSNVPFLESGDAGPASGTQAVLVGTGAAQDNAQLIVIGDITYMKGNAKAFEDMAGLSSAQATEVAGQWVLFSTNNATFSQVVAGIRSHDVAQEIELKGPYTLGPSRRLDGYKVDAIRGTEDIQGLKPQHAVLYVRASGRHLIVEEDTVGAKGAPNGVSHIIFSKWGETVRPKAPSTSISLGPVNAT